MPAPKTPPKMFETRSQAWRRSACCIRSARTWSSARAWRRSCCCRCSCGIVVLYNNRTSLLDPGPHGHAAARSKWNGGAHPDGARADVPRLGDRAGLRSRSRAAAVPAPGPGDGGTVGFLIRLATVGLALLVALGVAGVEARTLLVGGAFTAVILGLAAQQTLGNVIAGTVLLSARPVPSRRAGAPAGRAAGRPDRGDGQLAGAAVYDVRDGRGLGDGAEQRGAERRGAAAARARGRQPARAPARRDDARRSAGDPREVLGDAAARRAADHAGGARRRRGCGADLRDPEGRLGGRHLASKLLGIVSRETRSAGAELRTP